MSESESRGPRSTRRRSGREGTEFARATERLEEAIADLVRAASGSINQQASRVVDEMEQNARRLKEQFDAQLDEDSSDERPEHRRRRRRRRNRHWTYYAGFQYDPEDSDFAPGFQDDGARRGRKAAPHNGWHRDLYREPHRGWLFGVCAGLARYYGVEPWVARLATVTLFIFMPYLAFWGYVAAIFLLRKRPRLASNAGAGQSKPQPPSGRPSSAPELGPRLAPRAGLRSLKARFRDLELRLQRMERTVTSREFTLARELSELEGGASDRPAPA